MILLLRRWKQSYSICEDWVNRDERKKNLNVLSPNPCHSDEVNTGWCNIIPAWQFKKTFIISL